MCVDEAEVRHLVPWLCGKHEPKFEAMLESRVTCRFLVITLINSC